MFKRIALSLLLVSSFCGSLKAEYYLPEGVDLEQVKQRNNPETTEVNFDIHKVLAASEMGRIANIARIFSSFAMWKALASVTYTKITGRPTPASLAKKDIDNLSKSADSSGEAYVTIFENRGLSALATEVEKMSNAWKPRKGMLELVKKMNEKYTLRLASNIGPRLLKSLEAKFNKEYNNNLFDYFKPGKVVNYQSTMPAEHGHLASIGKPDARFYKEFNDTYNANDTKQFVFIDDKLENVQAATKAGWIGIHFNVENKNPMEVLYQDLTKIGFDLTPKLDLLLHKIITK